ncbi:MAG: glycoside hydrolase family 3 N-terminal domain-containing protein [Micropruina sp.]
MRTWRWAPRLAGPRPRLPGRSRPRVDPGRAEALRRLRRGLRPRLEDSEISDSELWNVYLPPFRAAVEAGAANIMSAYMDLNGVPASGNHWLLTDVLRGESPALAASWCRTPTPSVRWSPSTSRVTRPMPRPGP